MAIDVTKQAFDRTINSEDISSESSVSKNLLHELQLGEKLNESVHQARRADFSLMLAMLCNDVREQSQFILPKHKPAEVEITNSVLRKRFDLPKEMPLSLENLEQINQYNQAKELADNQLASIHLSHALCPRPLTFRDDKRHVPYDVLTNTSLVCQEKHATHKANVVLNKRQAMNVEGWLKNIQTSLVKSRLVSGVAA